MKQLEGKIVDIFNRRIFSGIISIDENGIISSIKECAKEYNRYIIPGFIDAHVHIESSMLLPVEFSKLAIQKGTVGIVNDPHEIANVLGREGISFMIENSKNSFIKTYFTIPSCVPATSFDSSGSCISSSDVEEMICSDQFIGLSEMMNVPGVIGSDPEVIRKIELTRKKGLIIDGHVPALSGDNLIKYIEAGISTDHECVHLEEALEKIKAGMKILIREGSAAKNYESLKSLIALHPDQVMFCTDDSHPGDLINTGHIDKIVKRAISDGFDLFDVLKIACINPVFHYGLNIGLLRIGDPGDFTILDNLQTFDVLSVYIDGKEKFNSDSLFETIPGVKITYPNHFNRDIIQVSDLRKCVDNQITCIKVLNNEIITEKVIFPVFSPIDNFQSDINRDILKIVYLNRYENKLPQIGFIHGIRLKRGAFATSISHDSHNIIAVGVNDYDLMQAINTVISGKGGVAIVDDGCVSKLSLPIAGIMTDKNGVEVAAVWDKLIDHLKEMGCELESPFMTLSFMALIVIPELKIGEKGLFEFSKFDFISE